MSLQFFKDICGESHGSLFSACARLEEKNVTVRYFHLVKYIESRERMQEKEKRNEVSQISV